MDWNNYYENYKLKPHAFSGRMDLNEISLPAETEEIGEYAFSECRNLAEVELPANVCRVGAHAFYNCRGLRKLTLFGQLKELEDGAFKNCHGLKEIKILAADPVHLNLHLILFEITQCVKVSLNFKDGTAVLVFPAYHYSFIANEPARIFSEESYGSGYYFRECFRREQADWKGYDSYFAAAVREEDFETVLAMAEGRILYPYELSAEARESYTRWLRQQGKELAAFHAKRNEPEILEQLADCGVLTGKWLDTAAASTAAAGKPVCTAALLQKKQRSEEQRKQKYEL